MLTQYDCIYSQVGIQHSYYYKKLIALRQHKIEYDKAKYFKKNYPNIFRNQYPKGTEKAYQEYLHLAAEIKTNKLAYLKFINNACKNNMNELTSAKGFYTYVNTSLPFDKNLIINVYDFFRIVRYSLLESNMTELPYLEDIPFLFFHKFISLPFSTGNWERKPKRS